MCNIYINIFNKNSNIYKTLQVYFKKYASVYYQNNSLIYLLLIYPFYE